MIWILGGVLFAVFGATLVLGIAASRAPVLPAPETLAHAEALGLDAAGRHYLRGHREGFAVTVQKTSMDPSVLEVELAVCSPVRLAFAPGGPSRLPCTVAGMGGVTSDADAETLAALLDRDDIRKLWAELRRDQTYVELSETTLRLHNTQGWREAPELLRRAERAARLFQLDPSR